MADRFDLHPDIQLNTTISSATFESPNTWAIEANDGSTSRAKFCVMALGCLSSASLPKIEGIEKFCGESLHTGRWPQGGVDMAGKRIAVIGTGSSGVQVIPRLAEEAAELYVFQRTPGFIVPARNRPLDAMEEAAVKASYASFRAEAKTTPNGHHPGPYGLGSKSALEVPEEERQEEYEKRWHYGGLSFLNSFRDLATNPGANVTAADFVRAKIRSIVKDEKTADLLSPHDIIGGKRLCVGTNYYETYNRPNVHLVDVRGGIDRITEVGIAANGTIFEVDCIVYATGYDAMTGPLLRIRICGTDGFLQSKWATGPTTFLGLATAGFPNMFIVTGPGSPSVLTNMVPSIEQNVDWIANCIAYMTTHAKHTIEVEPAAEEKWNEHNSAVARKFLRSAVGSWYTGANIPGKPQVFMPYMGGFPAYAHKCSEVANSDYEGFRFT